MLITMNVPGTFSAQSDIDETAEVIKAALDCMVTLNRNYLRRHPTPHIYESRIKYGRTTSWLTVPAMLETGIADCKSLAPWLVAYYRNKGQNAKTVFRYRPNPRTGFYDYHILVDGPNGWEDPSRILGMGKNENTR